jgi:hypothetical protein
MGPQSVGKVPDLGGWPDGLRLARPCAGPGCGRSWDCAFSPPWQAARPQIGRTSGAAGAVAGISAAGAGAASLRQTIIFGRPQDTTAGQQVTWTASSATTTPPPWEPGWPCRYAHHPFVTASPVSKEGPQ